MGKETKTVDGNDSQSAISKQSTPRTMPLEKAKKLIRKTAGEHKGLFRRLAK